MRTRRNRKPPPHHHSKRRNPLKQIVESVLSDSRRIMEIIDIWASFVIHDCFDEKVVQMTNFTSMIYRFVRLCTSQNHSISLSILGITILPDTVIPYQILREQELDSCIELIHNAETYFDRVESKNNILILEGYKQDKQRVLSNQSRESLIRCFLWDMLLARALCPYDRDKKRMTPYTFLSLSYLKAGANNALYLIRSDPYIGIQERSILISTLSDFIYDVHLLIMAL
jgi:hypothetical protein